MASPGRVPPAVSPRAGFPRPLALRRGALRRDSPDRSPCTELPSAESTAQQRCASSRARTSRARHARTAAISVVPPGASLSGVRPVPCVAQVCRARERVALLAHLALVAQLAGGEVRTFNLC